MNKLKLFLENFLVYGLGGIISKIIPLIMVPIITRLMPDTTYFGINDLANTIISIASAIAIMGMYDAMYRMFFEKEDEEYRKQVCSTAFVFTIGMSVVIFVLMLLLKDVIAEFFFADKDLAYLVYITATATLIGATNGIISAPTRMQNKRKIFLVTNSISPILSYAISVPLLIKGYYTIALPLAAVISGAVMEVSFGILNSNWFSVRKFDLNILKQMLVIAIPLLPEFLVYWIFNSSDRVMITNIMSIADAGIYSVGAKLGQASQLIYTAFAGGWQFFAFSTMKEENQVKSNSLIFEYLGIISFGVSAFVCAWSYFIFYVLFEGEYVLGYVAAPYLFMAPLLQMMIQVANNQFLVIKKTWPNMLILSIGAVLNVMLNILLIPAMGIEGAAIATLVGYAVADIICVVVLNRMKLMVISGRFLIAVILMLIYLILWRVLFREIIGVSTLMAITLLGAYIYLYKSDLKLLMKSNR